MDKPEKIVKLCIFFSFLLLWKGDKFVNAQGQTELYQLMDDLFTTYKPEVRPTTAGEATDVYIALYLVSIIDLDEKSQVLKTTLFLEVEWLDDYLSWDPDNYGGAEYFLYPQKKIWLPDLVVSNSVKSQTQLGYDENQVMIDSSGEVTWFPSEVIETSCDIDVTYYPFDTQSCSIVISTWVSTQEDIDVDPDSTTPIHLSQYTESGTWELVSTSYEELPNEDSTTRLQFTIMMRRLRTYYIINIITPVLLLSFTASSVFYLPADAGEKMGMSITVLLAYAVYLTIIADNMPQTSLQVSILAVYLTTLLAVTALAVVVSVLVLHMHHKPDDEPVGKKTKRLARSIRRMFKLEKKEKNNSDKLPAHANGGPVSQTNMETYKTDSKDQQPPGDTKLFNVFNPRRSSTVTPYEKKKDSNGQEEQQTTEVGEEITWQKVAQAVDRVFFIGTSAFIAVSTIVAISVLAIGGYVV